MSLALQKSPQSVDFRNRELQLKWTILDLRARTAVKEEQPAVPRPRTFAELPFSKPASEVAAYARTLAGASDLAILGPGDPAMFRFKYKGEIFSVHDCGTRLKFIVSNPSCPDATLCALQSHFAQLLSAHMRD